MPAVGLLHQERTDHSNCGLVVWKDADDAFSTSDLVFEIATRLGKKGAKSREATTAVASSIQARVTLTDPSSQLSSLSIASIGKCILFLIGLVVFALAEGMKSLRRRLAAQDGDTAEVSAKVLPRGYFLENYYTGMKRGQIKRLLARKKIA